MRNDVIVLGGLEGGYMKKLALYMKNRLNTRISVWIWEDEEADLKIDDKEHTILIGSEEFVHGIGLQAGGKYLIVLTDEETDEEAHVYRFQSCGDIYRDLCICCQKLGALGVSAAKRRRQNWLTVTTDGTTGTLLAFSVTCAQILGIRERVLYVNLCECSGMKQLLGLEQNIDLGDLILELRKGKTVRPEIFAGRLEQSDYLLPPDNPMILHELQPEDLYRFLEMIQKSDNYDWVVFALGNAVCGCERLIASSGRIMHLSAGGAVNACVKQAWMDFLKQCIGEKPVQIEQIAVPQIEADCCGFHLIGEWTQGSLGRTVRLCLEKGREAQDDSAMAGNSRSAFWGDGSFP